MQVRIGRSTASTAATSTSAAGSKGQVLGRISPRPKASLGLPARRWTGLDLQV
jgi:hypothetical protein